MRKTGEAEISKGIFKEPAGFLNIPLLRLRHGYILCKKIITAFIKFCEKNIIKLELKSQVICVIIEKIVLYNQ